MNDTMDEVYDSLVDILGYQNISGDIAVSGELRELLANVNSDASSIHGTAASGITEGFIQASGIFDAHLNMANRIFMDTMAIIINPI